MNTHTTKTSTVPAYEPKTGDLYLMAGVGKVKLLKPSSGDLWLARTEPDNGRRFGVRPKNMIFLHGGCPELGA